MKANSKEWWIIALGLLGSIVLGVVYPVFAIIFGQILDIFARPPSEILSGLHPWAGLFLVMGAVVSTGAFLKVRHEKLCNFLISLGLCLFAVISTINNLLSLFRRSVLL